IKEAAEKGCGLIVSHHPVIWYEMKSLCTDDMQAKRVMELIRNGISAICMHTNLDIANGGVNDVLCDRLELENRDVFIASEGFENTGLGRIGEYEKEYNITDYLELVKAALGAKCLEYYACRNVRKVALVGGSAAEFISDAFKAGADTFITSDIKYHDFQLAKELGINLIDAGHFNTENPVVFTLYKKLSDRFPDVEFYVSESNSSVTSFY
ncbi:MAG: Nif3-like dinuclear metal center hexameric protein, partial [Oscillospiraceae bacterium]|nr:Nif3-like dinuclear metal center hexameric protein [Oscillospiraceae bacterium]